jgi:NTE family protein
VRLIVLLLMLACAGVGPFAAADAGPAASGSPRSEGSPDAAPVVGRPRIGLVLSGGGARGAAHVGVLKVLEAERIPIDAIAGTSMGAVVGGLYASGLTARQIEELMLSSGWREAFREPGPRGNLSFRRKTEDQNFLVDFPLGLESGEFRLPKSLLSGQRLTQLLRRLTDPVATVRDFDDLPTRFRAMATDLETGDAVELRSGDLVTALRASLAAPAVFAPVEVDGRLLVDGGLANNLPVDAARAMGVDVLIVVDVGFPLRKREALESVATISNQMLAILIRRGSDAQLRALSPQDLLLQPELGEASSFDFDIVPRAAQAGEAAARARTERLAALRLPESDYARYADARAATRSGLALPVAEVRVAADSARYERLIGTAIADHGAAPATAPDLDTLDAAVTTLYGRGNFERVDHTSVERDGRREVEISAERNSWGPNYVRFGLNLEDDFSGNSNYNAAARFVLADIGPLAAEWVWDLQFGSEPRVATEFHQPFGSKANWFVMPQAQFEVRNLPLLSDGTRIAEYRLRTTEYGVDVGRELGNWGELRVGLREVSGHTRLRLGDPSLPARDDFDVTELFARFSYDTLDDRNFPRDGGSFVAEWRDERTDTGPLGSGDRVTADWLVARSSGRHTGVFWSSFGTHIDAAPGSVRTVFPLGGFLNLSGVAPDALSGRHFAIARALYYRQIGRRGEGFLNVPAYAGVSFEAGNVWDDRSSIGFDSALKQGSVFFGFDTLLGPVYLGTGFGEAGDTAFYLFLGRTF